MSYNLGTAVGQIILTSNLKGLTDAKSGLDDLQEKADETSKSISDSMKSISSSFLSLGETLSVAVTAPFTLAAKKAISAADDLNQSIDNVNAVFGDSAGIIQDWSKKTALAMGVTRTDALEAATSLGTMFQQMGIGQQSAAEMSKQLIQTGVDLGSFFDVDTSTALNDLIQGLGGATKALVPFGIDLSNARVDAEAVALGLAKDTKSVSDNAATMARYQLIMEQVGKAQGDFTGGINTFGNQMQVMKAQLSETAGTLAQTFLPEVTNVVKEIVLLLKTIQDLPPDFQKAAVAIAGVAAAIGPTLLIIGKLVDVFGLLLTPMGAVLAGIILFAAAWVGNVAGIQTATLTVFKNIADVFLGMIDIFNNLTQKGLDPFDAMFKTLIKTLSTPLGKDNPILGFLKELGLTLHSLGDDISSGNWSKFFQDLGTAGDKLGTWVSEQADKAKTFGATLLSNLTTSLEQVNWSQIGDDINKQLDKVGPWVLDQAKKVGPFGANLLSNILTSLGQVNWSEIGDAIGKGLGDIGGWVLDQTKRVLTFGATLLQTILDSITSANWSTVGDAVSKGLENLGSWVLSALDTVKTFGATLLTNMLTSISGANWDAVGTAVQQGIDKAGGFLGWVSGVLGSALAFGAEMFQNILKSIEGINWDTLKTNVGNAVKGALNNLGEFKDWAISVVAPDVNNIKIDVGNILSAIGQKLSDAFNAPTDFDQIMAQGKGGDLGTKFGMMFAQWLGDQLSHAFDMPSGSKMNANSGPMAGALHDVGGDQANMLSVAEAFVNQFLSSFTGALGDAFAQGVQDKAADIQKAVEDGLGNLWKTIQDDFSGFMSRELGGTTSGGFHGKGGSSANLQTMPGVWDQLVNSQMDIIVSSLKTTFEQDTDKLGEIKDAVGKWVDNITNTITTAINTKMEGAFGSDAPSPGLGGYLGQSSGVVGELQQNIEDTVSGIISSITGAFSAAQGKIADIQKAAQDFMDKVGSTIQEAFNTLTTGTATGVSGGFHGPGNPQAGKVGSMFSTLGEQLIGGLLGGAADKFVDLAKWINNDLPNGIKAAAGNLKDALFQSGKDLITGLNNGASDRMAELTQGGQWQPTLDFVQDIRNALGIHSPSTVFAEIGKNLMEGLALGVTDNENLALQAVQTVAQKVIVTAQNAAKTVNSTWQQMASVKPPALPGGSGDQNPITAAIGGGFSALGSTVSKGVQVIQVGLGNIAQAGADLAGQVKDAYDTASGSVLDAGKGISDQFNQITATVTGDMSKVSDAEKKYNQTINQINADLRQKLRGLDHDYNQSYKQSAQDRVQMERDAAQQIRQIQGQRVQAEQDAANQIKDIEQNRIEAQQKAEQDLADAQEQAQQQLADIAKQRAQTELTLQTALADAQKQYLQTTQDLVDKEAQVRSDLQTKLADLTQQWHENQQKFIDQQKQIRQQLTQTLDGIKQQWDSINEANLQQQRQIRNEASDTVAQNKENIKQIQEDLAHTNADVTMTQQEKDEAAWRAGRAIQALNADTAQKERDANRQISALEKTRLSQRADYAKQEKDAIAAAKQQQQQLDQERAAALKQYHEDQQKAIADEQSQLADLAKQQQAAAQQLSDAQQKARDDAAKSFQDEADAAAKVQADLAKKQQDIRDAEAKQDADYVQQEIKIRQDLAQKEQDFAQQTAIVQRDLARKEQVAERNDAHAAEILERNKQAAIQHAQQDSYQAQKELRQTQAKEQEDMERALGHTAGEQYAQGQAEGVTDKAPDVQTAVQKTTTDANAGAQSKVGDFQTTGQNLGDALVKGILGSTVKAMEAGKILAGAAQKGAEDQAKIQSPSKVWRELGLNMGSAMANGLLSTGALAENAARSNVKRALKATTDEFAKTRQSDKSWQVVADQAKRGVGNHPSRTAGSDRGGTIHVSLELDGQVLDERIIDTSIGEFRRAGARNSLNRRFR